MKTYFFLFFLLFIGTNKIGSTQEYKKSKLASGINQGISTVGNIALNIIEQNKQQKLLELQLQNNMNLMKQLGPQVAPPTSVSAFPNCPRPAANQPFPASACSNISDGNQMIQASMFVNLAHRHVEFLNAYSSPVQDGPTPVGLACMEKSMKKMQDGLQDKLNGMQNLSDKIRKAQQQFAEEAQSLKKQMDLLSIELNGGQSKDIKATGMDYTKYFPGCSGIIPKNALIGTRTGLIGIRDSMNATGMRQGSRDFLDNKNIYEKEIDTIVERMLKDLEKNGIDDWIEGGALPSKWVRGGMTNFKGLQDTVKEEVAELQIKRKRLIKDLEKFNYAPPRFDNNFENNFNDFALGAKSFFRKKYVDSCALKSTGSGDDKGLGLSPDDIYKRIVNVLNTDGGSTIPNYKAELKKILDSDDLVEDKIFSIKKLDKSYGNGMLKMRYIDENRKITYDTVSDFLSKAVSRCNKQYGVRNVYSKNKDRVQSYAQKAEEAQRAINELGLLFKTFKGKLATSIKDKIKHCSGAPQKEGSCNPKSLSPSSPNFCITQANQCAERTRACYNRAEALIIDRKKKLSNVGAIYNNRVGQLVTNQEQFLNDIKSKILADSQFLKQFFPGASFVLPPQLAVALPAPMDSKYGIQLRGGGELSFLNNLPFQLEKLQKSMFDQGQKVLKEAQSQVEKQKQVMTENKKKFEGLIESCNKQMANFQKDQQEKMEKAFEEQMEGTQKLSEFCQRFDRLKRTNPMAGCDGTNSPQELYSEAMKITSMLDSDVLPVIGAYESLCAQNQSERDLDYRRPYDKKTPLLIEQCDQAGGDWNNVVNSRVQLLMGQFDTEESRENVNSYLNGEASLPSSLTSKTAAKLKMLKTIKSYQGKKSKDFIRELNGPKPDKKVERLKQIQKELDNLMGDVKDYVKGSTARSVNKEVLKVKSDLLENKESASKSLDELLEKKDSFLEQLKDEEQKKSLEDIFSDLSRTRDDISDEALEKLPEIKDKGLGSKHRSKFSGNDSNNLCQLAKDEAVKKSIVSCQNEANFEGCYQGEIERNQNDLSTGGELYYINKKLASITEVKQENVGLSWKRLGQVSAGLCTARVNGKRGPKEIGETEDKLSEEINRILGRGEYR